MNDAINNPVDLPRPVYQATVSKFASRRAEIAATLEALIARIEQTTKDIDDVLAR